MLYFRITIQEEWNICLIDTSKGAQKNAGFNNEIQEVTRSIKNLLLLPILLLVLKNVTLKLMLRNWIVMIVYYNI